MQGRRSSPSAKVDRVGFVIGAVFLGFMAIGVPLAVLPIFVRARLGYSAVVVGWVIAAQSIATLLTRPIAAKRSDAHGPRTAAAAGLGACATGVVLYVVAALVATQPTWSIAVLFAGRAVIGLGESLLVTGALAWGIGLVGPGRAGWVMAWVGIAMYGALALGAPLGGSLLRVGGFAGAGIGAVAFPLLGLVASRLAAPTTAANPSRASFLSALGVVWRFGAGLALSTIAFGGLIGFLPLLYAERHWTGATGAFSAFGAAYVALRLVWGGLPDRLGGRPVAIASLAVETVGQVVLWRSSTPGAAMLGAALTGCGFSLVFPALGTLAIRSAASLPRGAVLGAYVAFFDLSLAVTGPVAGLVADRAGCSAVFLLGAASAGAALLLAIL